MVPTDAWLDEAVQAVRNDKVVGRGTCSSWDEAVTDEELKEALRKKFTPGLTAAGVVRWARRSEKIRQDYGDDIRGA